jgi:hypothetical protein
MYFEIIIFGAILFFLLNYSGRIKANKFIDDNKEYFRRLKESDYDFLVKVAYGEGVDADYLFTKRIRNGLLIGLIVFLLLLNRISIATLVVSIVVGFFVFKNGYSSLKKLYKKRLHKIDELLPYYLKGLEILIQHYTVPVALAKSIDDAPEIFKPGLREMIAKIDSGDSSIQPYMDFANQYPVRDSMRMMRLLYRLGLGKQEDKQERLLMFSRTVSNLQNKARETKYKERLGKMENQTMIMLIGTGASIMVRILFAMLYMFANL